MRGLVFYNNAVHSVICEGWYFIITLFARLYARVGILLTCGNHLHEHITSLREELWAHKTSLFLSLFIEVSVPNQENDWSCAFHSIRV